jgi:hypothetical protein
MDRGDAAEVREGGFGGETVGVVAGGDEQQGGGMDADAGQAQQARGGGLDQLSELIVEAGTVGVDVEDSAAAGGHGQLGGVHDGVAGGVRTQPGGRRGERSHRKTTEAFPQLIRTAEAEMTELVETPRAGLTAGTVSDEQHPDRFHSAIGGLGHRRRPAAQRGAGRFHGVDAVGLAVAAAGLTVGSIDLDHRHSGTVEEPGEAGPVGTGAFHPDLRQRPERTQPSVQAGEAVGGRRERLHAEQPSIGVECGGDMDIEVGVDPTGDRARLYDGHGHPFSVRIGQGVARTSREGDRDDRAAANRPIDHPPERGVPKSHPEVSVDRHLNLLDAPNQSDRSRRSR